MAKSDRGASREPDRSRREEEGRTLVAPVPWDRQNQDGAAGRDSSSGRSPERPREEFTGRKRELTVDGRTVTLTNLDKIFWPAGRITKGRLLQYYAEVAGALLPHLRGRAMVMKRYPNGIEGEFFFMKRAPEPRPEWIETCEVVHGSGSVINFPIVKDRASLLWVINLGCIDLNQWYARCDDVDRPDVLHFDLDPVGDAFDFAKVRETAMRVRETLEGLGMKPLAKTTGSRGIHVYVPIRRNLRQKQVWAFAKTFAGYMSERYPDLITAEYRKAKRPPDRVLVDYNQNAWGRTLASVYSARPREQPTVSTPVTWDEVEHGVVTGDFTIFNVPQRIAERGDLWAPLLGTERFNLQSLLE